jgi:hypothetical protein
MIGPIFLNKKFEVSFIPPLVLIIISGIRRILFRLCISHKGVERLCVQTSLQPHSTPLSIVFFLTLLSVLVAHTNLATILLHTP